MGKPDIEEGWDAGEVGSKARSRPREWPVISRLVRWRHYDVAFGLALPVACFALASSTASRA